MGIPSLRDNNRFRVYRDHVINAVKDSIGEIQHEIFVTPATHEIDLPSIVEAENVIIDKCMREGWDYLWLVEADIQVPKDAFLKLLSLNVDIACGYYPYHHDYHGLICGF